MEPTPKEVSAAMRYYGEHGEFPPDTPPKAKEIAEKMMAASSTIMECV